MTPGRNANVVSGVSASSLKSAHQTGMYFFCSNDEYSLNCLDKQQAYHLPEEVEVQPTLTYDVDRSRDFPHMHRDRAEVCCESAKLLVAHLFVLGYIGSFRSHGSRGTKSRSIILLPFRRLRLSEIPEEAGSVIEGNSQTRTPRLQIPVLTMMLH